MSAMQNGLTQKALSQGSTNIHQVYHSCPKSRTVEQAMERAFELEASLPDRVLPFAEDWDIVILAKEIQRLRGEQDDSFS